MCCGRGNNIKFNGTTQNSNHYSGSAVPEPEGPWMAIVPVRKSVNGVDDVVVDHEHHVVETYGEADALVREVDPITGVPRGGGVKRAAPGTPLTNGTVNA